MPSLVPAFSGPGLCRPEPIILSFSPVLCGAAAKTPCTTRYSCSTCCVRGSVRSDSGDPFAVRSWFLAGPGPRVFAPGRASEVSLVKENRIERFMTDQLASEPGSLERRLIEVYENDRDKRYETLASCLVGDSSQTGEPAILRELSELTLEAASNGSFLVLSGF